MNGQTPYYPPHSYLNDPAPLRRDPRLAVSRQHVSQVSTTPAPTSHRRPPSTSRSSRAKNTGLIKQPNTGPISHDQLVAEVKGIYAGLVRVESKCIEVDNGLNSQNDRLPASLEHMLMFIYLAYLMMALLYEAVPAFEDTLGRVSRRPWAL